MAVIELTTLIKAPPDWVFDLARDIDAHIATTAGTNERAVAGVTTGLIGLGDEVTWEARHLGFRQRLTVRITVFDRPRHFQDVMVSGAFKRMQHDHTFAPHREGTEITDRFEFESPFGFLGALFDRMVLAPYMRKFLVSRNSSLKEMAEQRPQRLVREEPRPDEGAD